MPDTYHQGVSYGGNTPINDTVVSENTVWSSQKTNTEIENIVKTTTENLTTDASNGVLFPANRAVITAAYNLSSQNHAIVLSILSSGRVFAKAYIDNTGAAHALPASTTISITYSYI